MTLHIFKLGDPYKKSFMAATITGKGDNPNLRYILVNEFLVEFKLGFVEWGFFDHFYVRDFIIEIPTLGDNFFWEIHHQADQAYIQSLLLPWIRETISFLNLTERPFKDEDCTWKGFPAFPTPVGVFF